MSHLRLYTINELADATDGWSEASRIDADEIGRHSAVFRGTLTEDDVMVVIKRIDVAGLPGFFEEISILQELQHPGLLPLLGIALEGGHDGLQRGYIVTPFCSGGDVQAHLDEIEWQHLIIIARDAAESISFLHTNHVIHRDVNPSNILLDVYNRVVLCDMGLARRFQDVFVADHAVGTPGYMDEECVRDGTTSEASDVFAFGVTLLVMLSRRSALSYHDGQPRMLVEEAASQDIRDMCDDATWPLDSLPARDMVCALTRQCLDPSRAARPSMGIVFQTLQRIVADRLAIDRLPDPQVECLVCGEANPIVSLLPCRHNCMCELCTLRRMESYDERCPVCECRFVEYVIPASPSSSAPVEQSSGEPAGESSGVEGEAPIVEPDEGSHAELSPESRSEIRLCVICLERDRAVYLPCHHGVLCEVCALEIIRRGEACPLCRLPFHDYDLNAAPQTFDPGHVNTVIQAPEPDIDVPEDPWATAEQLIRDDSLPQNGPTAVRLYEVEAARGNRRALIALADCHDCGVGVGRVDRDRRDEFLRRASADGDPLGAAFCIFFDLNDNGPNKQECYRISMQIAMGEGDVRAIHLVGLCLEKGFGTVMCRTEALEWYMRGAELGHPGCMTRLASFYEHKPHRPHEALVLYGHAARLGHVLAQKCLGLCYLHGRGCQKDEIQAIEWLRRSAMAGLPAAQYLLGTCYLSGRGTMQSNNEAMVWFRRAAHAGIPMARDALSRLEGPPPGILVHRAYS